MFVLFEEVIQGLVECGWCSGKDTVAALLITAIFQRAPFSFNVSPIAPEYFTRVYKFADQLSARGLSAHLHSDPNFYPPLSTTPAVYAYIRIAHATAFSACIFVHPDGPRIVDDQA